MAIALEGFTTFGHGSTTNPLLTAGTNRLLVILASTWVGSPLTLPVLSYAGVPLTQLAYPFMTAQPQMNVLLAPASGTNNITFTNPGYDLAFVAASFSGIDQAAPYTLYNNDAGAGSSTPTSAAITTGVANWIVGGPGIIGLGITPNAGQTAIGQQQDGNPGAMLSYKVGTGAPATLGWSGYPDGRWCVTALALLAAGGAVAPSRLLASAGAGT